MKRFHILFPKVQNKSVMMQLFIQLFAIVLVMIAVLLMINTRFIEALFFAKARYDLSDVVSQINDVDLNSPEFYEDVNRIETDDSFYVEVFGKNRKTILYSTAMNEFNKHFFFDFEVNSSLMFDYIQPKKLVDLRDYTETEDGTFFVAKETPSETEYLVYEALLDSGHVVKVYSYLNVIESNAQYTSIIMRTIICVLGLALIIGFFIYSWRFTRPLIEMNEVTKNVAKMDFSKKCVAKSTNELGQLADNINSMSDSLARAMGDLKEKNVQLQLDIEHEHKMEKSRKEFVSNVSHELKTPIAIIQGYAEGLKLGINDNPEMNEEYLDVIIEESKRMNTLVLDLLELSYYESGTYKLSETQFLLDDMIEDYLSSQRIILEDKNITLSNKLPDDMIAFGDEQKLSMVLNNYFSNAISYCKNEKIIEVSAEEFDEFYRINVFNTGENISDEIIEEMWDNFFRGDKSHRRGEGHFGIGLSIVAAIQNMHSMKFGCSNKENGVNFWFDVKKCVKDLSI